MHIQRIKILSILLLFIAIANVNAQQNLAQEAYAIFEQSCLICHGENGSYRESLIIEYKELIEGGTVIPGNPGDSVFYQRLIETNIAKRMPLSQPPLAPEAIETIRQWIAAGAPDWNAAPIPKPYFITTDTILETIETHVNSLSQHDRSFARYFMLTHLYNAGETTEALNAYRRALSKLINSLSWGRNVVKPQPIDAAETVYYIDLRDYEWDIRNEAWTRIEQAYPYQMTFDVPTQTHLQEKLTTLQQNMNCDVPLVQVDWFLATASLPPLYNDILDLPGTDRELETALNVSVIENLQNAPGKRVWRAGFNDSGVSRHNRIVERHISQHGAYWKSYDFAGSADSQNIFTHPLDFTHDGGEIIFSLPNGLQAYFLIDGVGTRLDVAPTEIVSDPAANDPAVRNGLSCIGCHTEGMKTFEDEVRAVVEQVENPPFNKERVLNLYVEKTVMDDLLDEDMQRYRTALEAAGGVFGGIEPVQRFHEVFKGPLSASQAAATVGLETDVFLEKISNNVSLQNLLGALVIENGAIKRDAWTSAFHDVIAALDSPDSVLSPVEQRPERIPGASIDIPDPKLRAAIAEALGKTPGESITVSEIATLEKFSVGGREIETLEGLQWATNLEELNIWSTDVSDLTPLAGLTKLTWLRFTGAPTSDLSPLSGLTNLKTLILYGMAWDEFSNFDFILDISPLAGLTELRTLHLQWNRIANISPLAWLTNLRDLDLENNRVSDLSPLSALKELRRLNLRGMFYNFRPEIRRVGTLPSIRTLSDISPLAGLTNLGNLDLGFNEITDVSPLANLQSLYSLKLEDNKITDVSPLANLLFLRWLHIEGNNISDISPLDRLRNNTHVVWFYNPCFPQGGPIIEGPWLWTVVPGEVFSDGTDLLSVASDGAMTELKIATNGAIEGNSVGEHVWISHKVVPRYVENDRYYGGFAYNEEHRRMVNAITFGKTGVVYGSAILYFTA